HPRKLFAGYDDRECGALASTSCKASMQEAKTQILVSQRGSRPSCCGKSPSKLKRAQGMPGARCTHSLACKMKTSIRVSHHRFAETLGHSLRDGVTVSYALSPVTGLFCHRHRRNCSRQLDTSVGVPGPHAFSVRQ